MKIFIIGSGNVASHLARHLYKNGHLISGIYSRNPQHAEKLAKSVSCLAFDNLKTIPTSADVYLLCISDSALPDLASQMPLMKNVIAHTAGSVDISILKRFEKYGVFYPLQTFTRDRETKIDHVPFCIEANSEFAKETLVQLAISLSKNVIEINSEQRLHIHLAAVFANNFVNHMYVRAEEIMAEYHVPFALLKPLMMETIQKAIELGPIKAQTGPARRGDLQVIENHIALLTDETLKNLYSFVSNSIIKKTKEKHEQF
jgi:predicted short-subunit dehydrogenase-like oxidoreductase (DUF2520 family)